MDLKAIFNNTSDPAIFAMERLKYIAGFTISMKE